MKIINNKEELLSFCESNNEAYDVDANWVLWEMDYTYPILIDYLGWDHKGQQVKVYEKTDMDALKKFINT